MITPVNEWGQIITSVADGTQPATSYGTSVTPGITNAYGSYATVISGASVTADVYAIEININNVAAASTSRGCLVTIGFDPAGGTAFGGLGGVTGNEISHLLASSAEFYYSNARPSGGMRFYFPIFIKSGTSIGAKAQTNAGAAGSCNVAVTLFCQPKRPDLIRTGSFVRTYGITTASTDGTSVTQGTAAEGSWTSVATTSDRIWYLQGSVAAKSSAQVDALSHTDFGSGDGSNKRVLLRDVYMLTSTAEAAIAVGRNGTHCDIASGDTLYARSQATAAQSGFQVACYGVGG